MLKFLDFAKKVSRIDPKKKNNFSTQKLTKMFDIYLKYIPSLCDPS